MKRLDGITDSMGVNLGKFGQSPGRSHKDRNWPRSGRNYRASPVKVTGEGNIVDQFLKSVIEKITQETFLGWKEALPIALLCTHIAPKEQVGLSPYEMLYGRPLFMSMTSS